MGLSLAVHELGVAQGFKLNPVPVSGAHRGGGGGGGSIVLGRVMGVGKGAGVPQGPHARTHGQNTLNQLDVHTDVLTMTRRVVATVV